MSAEIRPLLCVFGHSNRPGQFQLLPVVPPAAGCGNAAVAVYLFRTYQLDVTAL